MRAVGGGEASSGSFFSDDDVSEFSSAAGDVSEFSSAFFVSVSSRTCRRTYIKYNNKFKILYLEIVK